MSAKINSTFDATRNNNAIEYSAIDDDDEDDGDAEHDIATFDDEVANDVEAEQRRREVRIDVVCLLTQLNSWSLETSETKRATRCGSTWCQGCSSSRASIYQSTLSLVFFIKAWIYIPIENKNIVCDNLFTADRWRNGIASVATESADSAIEYRNDNNDE